MVITLQTGSAISICCILLCLVFLRHIIWSAMKETAKTAKFLCIIPSGIVDGFRNVGTDILPYIGGLGLIANIVYLLSGYVPWDKGMWTNSDGDGVCKLCCIVYALLMVVLCLVIGMICCGGIARKYDVLKSNRRAEEWRKEQERRWRKISSE